jgi:hypothetical protein
MCGDLLKKFIAQHDDVFMRIARQAVLVSAVVPDPRFAEKIETRAMHDFRIRGKTVRAKEDRREAWVLGDRHVKFQAGVIQQAVLHDHEAFITDLLDLNPALLHSPVRTPSHAIDFAFTYVKTHLLPTLLRIWPLPDDLAHAAGNGDLVSVKRWFDATGQAALGDLANHFPTNNPGYCRDLQWGEPKVQQVVDTALAWAVLNNHFDVADFLLSHGANINTDWCSHEPASILHELVWYKNYEAMQFLIDRGIDMTIRDYRWGGTAEGWASVAAKDEKMAQWLRDAQQRREQASH